MEIRQGTQEDIGAIISLLKLSLGEELMPKSEKYWRWKHIDNPFGPSPVLLCWDAGTLVGVRAFMQWQWIFQGRVYRAVRAVDTATHPAYQGKGIFKKLTLGLVSECLKTGHDFVFNTPNSQSQPGYLKMGWVKAGRLPIRAQISRPISVLRKLISKSVTTKDVGHNSTGEYFSNGACDSLLKTYRDQAKRLITNVSSEYLAWRYLDVPVAKYVAIVEERGNELQEMIIARTKDTSLGRELRVTDMFLRGPYPSKALVRRFEECKTELEIDYCTLSGSSLLHGNGRLFGRIPLNLNVGPMVTVRSLSTNNLDLLKRFNRWSPSLGDLELF